MIAYKFTIEKLSVNANKADKISIRFKIIENIKCVKETVYFLFL